MFCGGSGYVRSVWSVWLTVQLWQGGMHFTTWHCHWNPHCVGWDESCWHWESQVPPMDSWASVKELPSQYSAAQILLVAAAWKGLQYFSMRLEARLMMLVCPLVGAFAASALLWTSSINQECNILSHFKRNLFTEILIRLSRLVKFSNWHFYHLAADIYKLEYWPKHSSAAFWRNRHFGKYYYLLSCQDWYHSHVSVK